MIFKKNIAILLILFSFLFVSCSGPAAAPDADELLSLGEKYLLELNYEEAIVQFTKVIEVDPNNARAYIGLAEAYTGLGEHEKAKESLDRGLAQLPGDSTLLAALNEIMIQSAAREMIQLYETNGYETVIEYMQMDEIKNLDPSAESMIYILEEDTIGCGFYFVNDKMFLYIGGYEDGLRSGQGIWLTVNEEDQGYYLFNGLWSQDMPNGEGEILTVRDESAIEKEEGKTYGLQTKYVGTFMNGIEEGPINIQWIMDNGHTHLWAVTASSGYYQGIDSNNKGETIVAYCSECNASLKGEEKMKGVQGFIN